MQVLIQVLDQNDEGPVFTEGTCCSLFLHIALEIY